MALLLNPAALSKLVDNEPTAWPMIIREKNGLGRTIILRGSSLPFKGVNFGIKQRVNITKFPGNPIAQSQVMGVDWLDTRMEGHWVTRNLSDIRNSPVILNFPAVAPALSGKTFLAGGSVPGNTGFVDRAAVLRDAFYLLARSGQRIQVEWGTVARVGFLQFDPAHEMDEDIYWTMDWTWIGDTDAPEPPPLLPKIDPPGVLAALIASINAFLDEVITFLAKYLFVQQQVFQTVAQIGSFVNTLIGLLEQLTALAYAPLDLLNAIDAMVNNVISNLLDLIQQIRGLIPAYFGAKEGKDQSEQNLLHEIAMGIIFNARQLGVDGEALVRALQRLREPDVIAVVEVTSGQTLRDVAIRYYDGRGDEWVRIADFNNLSGSVVPAGTVVRVPK